jgi:peptidoglycan hydrolase-like protein with peptidoglycan-binding domain
MGPKTAAAVRTYQADWGLVADGILDAEVLCHLAALSGLPLREPGGTSDGDGRPSNRFESRMWPNALVKP